MRSSITTRLDKLEAAKPGTIILEVTDRDGETRRLTAKEYAESGYTWPTGRIVSGSALSDLDLLLATVKSVID